MINNIFSMVNKGRKRAFRKATVSTCTNFYLRPAKKSLNKIACKTKLEVSVLFHPSKEDTLNIVSLSLNSFYGVVILHLQAKVQEVHNLYQTDISCGYGYAFIACKIVSIATLGNINLQ